MNNLLQSWDQVASGWADKNIMLFLDYDGTLAPIAPTPEQAVLPVPTRQALETLSKVPQCQIVVLSGRALSDVKSMVGVEGIDYIGNHGWEIDGPHIRFESLIPPQIMSALEDIRRELSVKLSAIDGAFVEDKGITLTVHYRLVAEDKESLVRQIFDRICVPYSRHNKIKIHMGKKVLEVRPAIDWDKGKAALWFLKRQQLVWGNAQVLPIYVGDDITDEEAFKALREKGVTVFVGNVKGSHAEYFLDDPQQVGEFLKHLLSSMAVAGK